MKTMMSESGSCLHDVEEVGGVFLILDVEVHHLILDAEPHQPILGAEPLANQAGQMLDVELPLPHHPQ